MIEHLLQPLVCERFWNDARYRDGHLRVVNALPKRHVLGLHSPEMKQMTKQLSHNGGNVVVNGNIVRCTNGKEIINSFETMASESLCYEETVVWGFLINIEKCVMEERFAMLERYIPVLDNWAVCDSYCANAKWMAKADKEALWMFLQPYFNSAGEFEVRFAIVASMCCLLCDGWVGKVFERIDALCLDDIASDYRTVKGKPKSPQEGSVQGAAPYYVRMGIAWLLATALAKFPEQTRSFVNVSRLPSDVVRLYVRKARESFRTRTVNAL